MLKVIKRLSKIIVIISVVTVVINSFHNDYPNCVRKLNITSSKNHTAQQSFLNISSFLLSSTDQTTSRGKQTFLRYLNSGDYGQVNQQINQNLLLRSIVIILLVLFVLSIFFIRTIFFKKVQVQKVQVNKVRFSNRGKAFIVYGASLLLIGFGIASTINIKQFQNHTRNLMCSVRLFPDMLKYGDSEFDWLGIQSQKDKINNTIGLLKFAQSINHSNYNYTSFQIKNQIQIVTHQQKILQWFINQTTLSIGINATYALQVLLKDVVAKLSGQNSYSLNISNSVQNLRHLADRSWLLYNSVEAFLDSISQSGGKLKQHLKVLTSIYQNLQKVYQVKDTIIQENFRLVEISTAIIEAVISLSMVSSFALIAIIVFLQARYSRTTYKMFALLWYLQIIIFFAFFVSLMFSQIIMLNNQAGCNALQQILSNRSLFQQTFTQKSHNPNLSNMYLAIQDCLYENRSQNNNFLEKHGILNDLNPAIYMFSNQSELLQMNKISHKKYISMLQHNDIIQRLQRHLKKQKFCQVNSTLCKFPGLVNTLSKLNQYSFSDSAGQSCFKDVWVIDRSDCPSNVAIISDGNHIPYQIGQVYSKKSTTCLSFNVYDKLFKTNRTLTQIQFISIYIGSQTICPNSYTKILQFGKLIIDNLYDQQIRIDPIITQVANLKRQIQKLGKLLRTFYYLKKKQYEELFNAYAVISQTAKDSDLNYLMKGNNCSSINYHINSGYSVFCYDLRVQIRKLVLSILAAFILNGILIIAGYIYSIEYKNIYNNEQIFESNRQQDFTENSHVSQEHEKNSQNQISKRESDRQIQYEFVSQDISLDNQLVQIESMENNNVSIRRPPVLERAIGSNKNQDNLKGAQFDTQNQRNYKIQNQSDKNSQLVEIIQVESQVPSQQNSQDDNFSVNNGITID